jgi:hypothetical protein
MFPRQFGLHSVFTHITDRRETTHAFRDYTDREAEINVSPKNRDEKIYVRLGTRVLPLIVKMQKLHRDCSYHALMTYYCSTASTTARGEIANEAVETSAFLTQKEISTIPTKPSQEKEVDGNQNLIRYHTPHHKVFHIEYKVKARLLHSSGLQL